MARYTIRCPVCRKQKSGDTRHGFKVFALMHGVRCSATTFRINVQLTIDDFLEAESDDKK